MRRWDAAGSRPRHNARRSMKRDLYAEVSSRIVAELEAGAAPWIKPWSATAGANTPCNAATNRPYSGCNVTLHPEYGRFVAALHGVFAPAVADQGLIHGAAPASSSATMRDETSA